MKYFFAILLVFIYLVYKGRKIEKAKLKDGKLVNDIKSKRKHQKIEGNFNKFGAARKMTQILESLYIVSTTKNPDTFESRFALIYDFFDDLKTDYAPFKHLKMVKNALKSYKSNYHDRDISNSHRDVISYLKIEDLQKLQAKYTLDCFKRFVAQKQKEMSNLKRADAIEKRRVAIIDSGYSLKYMFKTYSLPNNGELEAIENIRAKFLKKNFDN